MKKITYLELLNLIKENKQPKEIIYNKDKYIWQEYDYHLVFGTSLSETINYCTRSLAFVPIIEIIEEDKPIEKIRQFCEYPCSDKYECWSIKEDILVNKINELIDVVNELKESRGKIRCN